ncbi:hypothetical protein PG996_012934 [Apiospora saccharicola]|uniref:Uncharacterized protein n=1 Tax=Apiospora saccharicola TaxID=335842 RepID=A0ABR1U462_9PEZI
MYLVVARPAPSLKADTAELLQAQQSSPLESHPVAEAQVARVALEVLEVLGALGALEAQLARLSLAATAGRAQVPDQEAKGKEANTAWTWLCHLLDAMS